MDTISCKHGNLARSCEICTLIAERDALSEENTRFREKLDLEKIAHILFEAWGYPFKWPEVGFKNARKFLVMSDSLIKYLTE